MSMGDIAVLLAIAAAIGLTMRSIRKSGKSGCTGCCAACSRACAHKSGEKQQK